MATPGHSPVGQYDPFVTLTSHPTVEGSTSTIRVTAWSDLYGIFVASLSQYDLRNLPKSDNYQRTFMKSSGNDLGTKLDPGHGSEYLKIDDKTVKIIREINLAVEEFENSTTIYEHEKMYTRNDEGRMQRFETVLEDDVRPPVRRYHTGQDAEPDSVTNSSTRSLGSAWTTETSDGMTSDDSNDHSSSDVEESGALFTLPDYNSRSPLHVAASTGNPEAVTYLLHNGLNVHAKDLMGMTPLMRAVRSGNMECVRAIHAAGGVIDGDAVQNGMELCYALQSLQAYAAAGCDLSLLD